MTTVSSPYNTPHEDEGVHPILAWLIRLPILLLMAGMLLAIVFMLLVGAFRYRYLDLITPGVSAFGVDLGGMSREEAIETLSQRFTYDQDTVFTFRDGNQTWELSAQALGLSFDVEATVDQALAQTQPDDHINGLLHQADVWRNGYAVTPIIHYDQSLAVNHLMRLAEVINQPAQSASLHIDENFNVTTLPAQAGRILDIEASLNLLNNAILSLNGDAEIPLIVNETLPKVSSADHAISRIETALSSELSLTAVSETGEVLGPWTISPAQIASLLKVDLVDNPDGTQHYRVDADLSGFASTLEQLAPALVTLPADGRFQFDPITRQLIPIKAPIVGRALNVEATLERLQNAVFNTVNREVAMVFDYVQPRYHANITAAELGITELIGEATTYYTGSGPNRRHNIAEGTARINGVIIAPNEEFSFNDLVGEISFESGFKEGAVIIGDSTVAGVGGGICQVSTTIFRAALNAGYWITERNTHAYRVHYYELNGQPTGMDAAIWSPERDFKFLNDTPYHILIEAVISPNNSELTFRIYSTSIGRQVVIEPPQIQNVQEIPPTRYVLNSDLQAGEIYQVEVPAEGMDVTVIRRVTEADGTTRTDRVFTHYLPWRAVYEVGPGDARLNQSGG
jgi:vancomycin resistance protein YoaR